MSTPSAPPQAQRVAAQLSAAFTRDQQLAKQLGEAQQRLGSANDDLWSGLHPEALGLLYDETAAVGIRADGRIRSEVTALMADTWRLNEADDEKERYEKVETAALLAVQKIHWRIHRAFIDYQNAAEDRRHLAAEIGELVGQLVLILTAAGWSEEQARNANVDELAGRGSGA
jgi:hypothetical protein